MKKETLLTVLILAGLVLGVLFGQYLLFDPAATAEAQQQIARPYQTAGNFLFIRPLQMLIIPLVFVAVVSGVCAIGNPSKLGLVGGATLTYYLATTLIAVVLGLVLVNVIKPGAAVSQDDFSKLQMAGRGDFEAKGGVSEKLTGRPEDVGGSFLNLLESFVPNNPLRSAVNGDILAVVMFAIFIGLALVLTGPPAKPVIEVIDGLFAALIKIVMWIIWLAPIGVFLLVAAKVGEKGLAKLIGPLALYMLAVLAGLAIHLFVILPVILAVLGRCNPYRFLWDLRKVILTAFSTASSNATLPVTIEECQTVGRCSRRATSFVVPLGSTVNMNGTALYEAVAVSFLFQLFAQTNPQFHLTLSQQLVILVTATLAAIGAAGIPAAGLVTMAIVIGAVNTSLKALHGPDAAQLPLWTIGIIVGVDRVLDMCRTVVNVMGDAIGARIITRIAPD
ncbi:MAG: dicarboxylate/amino acid:cation symporter [Phycisphaerales bacterium]|nr:dicarboxylate/amino acid:cation symporter [Phycisphaerales bacterium]